MRSTAKSKRSTANYANNLIGALALALTDRTDRALEETLDVGGHASSALMSIGTRPGQSVDQLAHVLGLSHSATVRVVDRLEQRGWVQRMRMGHDGRTASLTPTPPGRATFRRLLATRNAVLNQVTAVLSDHEVVTLRRLLSKMLASLPNDRRQARHICRLCEHAVCRGADCPVGSAV